MTTQIAPLKDVPVVTPTQAARMLALAMDRFGCVVEFMMVAAVGFNDPRPNARESAAILWDLGIDILMRRSEEHVIERIQEIAFPGANLY